MNAKEIYEQRDALITEVDKMPDDEPKVAGKAVIMLLCELAVDVKRIADAMDGFATNGVTTR